MLPAAVTARVSIEAGIAQPWWRWLGSAGRPVSLEHYGASADVKTLFKEFGITAEAAVAAAKRFPGRKPAQIGTEPEPGDQHHAGADNDAGAESGTAND